MEGLLFRALALIAIFASIFLFSQFVLGGYFTRRAETSAVNKRLKLLQSGLTVEQAGMELRKGAVSQLAENAGPMARLWHHLQRQVRMAALSIDPKLFVLGCLLAFAAVMGGLLFLAWIAQFSINLGVVELILIISVSLTLVLPYLFINRQAEKRRKKMEEQFPVALDVFTRALRAGHPVASAIDLLTKEMEDPLGTEFGLVADEVAYGANLTDALSGMASRWDLEDIRMFVVSLSLQSETGGNLAEILQNLSTVIRDRASMYMKVRALSSEGRMSGWMLTVLPVFTLVSMFLFNPAFYLDVAEDPIFVYGFSGLVILYIIGVLIIRRMIDLKV